MKPAAFECCNGNGEVLLMNWIVIIGISIALLYFIKYGLDFLIGGIRKKSDSKVQVQYLKNTFQYDKFPCERCPNRFMVQKHIEQKRKRK